MDLNYLFARHQISLIRAQNAGEYEARIAHHRLADEYAARIEAMKTQLGADFHTAAA